MSSSSSRAAHSTSSWDRPAVGVRGLDAHYRVCGNLQPLCEFDICNTLQRSSALPCSECAGPRCPRNFSVCCRFFPSRLAHGFRSRPLAPVSTSATAYLVLTRVSNASPRLAPSTSQRRANRSSMDSCQASQLSPFSLFPSRPHLARVVALHRPTPVLRAAGAAPALSRPLAPFASGSAQSVLPVFAGLALSQANAIGGAWSDSDSVRNTSCALRSLLSSFTSSTFTFSFHSPFMPPFR